MQISFETLSNNVKQIDISVRQAERVYRQVLVRHQNSAKLLRLYSRFMFDIKNDPWAASRFLE